MNRSRRGIISSGGVLSSIAPTSCLRTYRTARVPWRRRVCESRTAPRATPRHENHARCCVWVSLCGSDLRFTVEKQFEPQIGTERDGSFKLRENGTNGFGAETQPQPQINFKIKTQPKIAKRFVVSVLSRERKHPETPNPFNYNESSRIGQWQCKTQ